MARAPPRDRKRAEAARPPGTPPAAATPKPTPGERAAARQQRRQERRAHRAGVAAIRRERLRTAWMWIWPEHTRDIGRPLAVAVLVLNIVPFPGLGTALYGRVGRGALQFLLTFVFLLGWIWAMADGVRILRRAFGPPRRG